MQFISYFVIGLLANRISLDLSSIRVADIYKHSYIIPRTYCSICFRHNNLYQINRLKL